MIQSFHDQGAADLFDGRASRPARQKLPQTLWRVAQRKLDQLDSAETLTDLRVPPGNRLEALRADRRGQHSIRINDQYRIWLDRAWSRTCRNRGLPLDGLA